MAEDKKRKKAIFAVTMAYCFLLLCGSYAAIWWFVLNKQNNVSLYEPISEKSCGDIAITLADGSAHKGDLMRQEYDNGVVIIRTRFENDSTDLSTWIENCSDPDLPPLKKAVCNQRE